jgi:single-strand DNA-binding protein
VSKSINQVILMGNLTNTPEIRQLPSGNSKANFALALNRSYKDADGQWQDAVDYVDIVAWGTLASQVHESLDKGSRVLVSGRLQNSVWQDKETGAKRSKMEVLATDVTFLDRARSVDVEVL